MGLVLAGGDLLKVSLNMPFRIVDIFSGVILFCLIGSELFFALPCPLGQVRRPQCPPGAVMLVRTYANHAGLAR